MRRSPTPGPPDLARRIALRPKEAAEALGISERTLRALLPELPVVRRGGIVLIPVQALQTWLLEQAQIEGDRVESVVKEVMESVGQ